MSLRAGSISAPARGATPDGRLARIAGHTPWLILAYFTAQVASRVLISPVLEMDEAEQVVLAQSPALGYGPKPPLYTWLQTAAFWLLGESVLALSLLKNLLLAAAVGAAYAVARTIARDPLTGALAAASVFLVPQIAWEAQRDLTTTVLAVTAAFCTFLAVVRVTSHGRRRDYALLGAVLAAGLLAKYNFVVLPAALLVAALSLPALRPAVLCPRFALTLLVFALCAGPHLVWVGLHADVALTDAGKLDMGAGAHPASIWATGLFALAKSSASVVLLLAALYAAAWWCGGRAQPQGSEAVTCTRLLWRTLGAGLVLCAVLVVAFQITVVKDRWLLPLLCLVPLALALHSHRRLGEHARLGLIGAGVLCALAALGLLATRTVLGPEIGATNRLHFPAPALARKIQSLGLERDVIASDEAFIAGNLNLALPKSAAVVAGLPVPDAALRESCWLLVWDAARTGTVPPALARLYARTHGAPPATPAPAVIEAPLRHAPARQARLALVPAGGPECGLR